MHYRTIGTSGSLKAKNFKIKGFESFSPKTLDNIKIFLERCKMITEVFPSEFDSDVTPYGCVCGCRCHIDVYVEDFTEDSSGEVIK